MSIATTTWKKFPRRGLMIGAMAAASLLLAGCHVYGHNARGSGNVAVSHGNPNYYENDSGYRYGQRRQHKRRARKHNRRQHDGSRRDR